MPYIKLVPSSKLSPQTLRAGDYIVEKGQIWRDPDKRRPRRLEVLSVMRGPRGVRVRNVETGRTSRIWLGRFNPTTPGCFTLEKDTDGSGSEPK